MKNWQTLYEDTDAIYARNVKGSRVWFVVRIEDLADTDIEGDRFSGDVLRIDLSELSSERLKAALDCVGREAHDPDPDDLTIVDACVSYGCYAPLFSTSGSRFERVRAAARREAERLMRDAAALEKALDRPVNRIGSTARDFGRGNHLAGLVRYASEVAATGEAPDPTKNLVLKMYGANVEIIKHIKDAPRTQIGTLHPDGSMTNGASVNLHAIPSDDPIAYMTGFQDGLIGRPIEDEDLAVAYVRGREHGTRVHAGTEPMPAWYAKTA